jgi:hypothetical protein
LYTNENRHRGPLPQGNRNSGHAAWISRSM